MVKNEVLLIGLLDNEFPNMIWIPEYEGISDRKFRFDAASPYLRIAIEIDGGIWLGKNGGHTSGYGRMKDMTKYNLAVLNGWRVLTYSPATLKKNPNKIIEDIKKLL